MPDVSMEESGVVMWGLSISASLPNGWLSVSQCPGDEVTRTFSRGLSLLVHATIGGAIGD
ncbi:MAG: hypothetical protein AAGG48_28650 [Planctomycetota bacterium]